MLKWIPQFSGHIGRLYQIEKWKWLLVVGLVTVTHLFCQSLMLPYSKALLSLVPDSNKFPVNEKDVVTSTVVDDDDLLVVNSSNLVEDSLLSRSTKILERVDLSRDVRSEKQNEVFAESKVSDNGVDFVEDADLDKDIAFEVGDNNDDGSVEYSTELKLKFPGSSVIKETVTADDAIPLHSSTSSAPSNVSRVTGSALSTSLKGVETKESVIRLKSDVAASVTSSAVLTKPVVKKMKCEMPPKTVMPLQEMERLLVRNRARSRAMRPRWSSERDQEILSAKLQIENAPILKNDPDLYGPLFRNVSTFKRSYELMERILKVYVYKEGERPVFHTPIMKGLYASEGWFMKLMEGNKRFVVKDPKRAHLFYMPFSSRMLEYKVYVRNSHNRTNLRAYLKDYSEKIAAKYRFWNRTGGADHFLVACHDWAPYETRHHMEHCIKALCNADVTIGFKIGRDVSFPETYVRSARDPQRDLGGKPASQRHILAFYAGNMHGYLRPILLQHWKDKDPKMRIFGPMPPGVASKMNYIQHMKASKFCICPKGYEVNSPRVVEAIFYECVPVIISDNFVPPFFEVLNWSAFSLILAEKDIPRLREILLSIPEERYREMQLGVRKIQRHFLWHAKPEKYDLFHMTLHSIWYNRVFQMKLR